MGMSNNNYIEMTRS